MGVAGSHRPACARARDVGCRGTHRQPPSTSRCVRKWTAGWCRSPLQPEGCLCGRAASASLFLGLAERCGGSTSGSGGRVGGAARGLGVGRRACAPALPVRLERLGSPPIHCDGVRGTRDVCALPASLRLPGLRRDVADASSSCGLADGAGLGYLAPQGRPVGPLATPGGVVGSWPWIGRRAIPCGRLPVLLVDPGTFPRNRHRRSARADPGQLPRRSRPEARPWRARCCPSHPGYALRFQRPAGHTGAPAGCARLCRSSLPPRRTGVPTRGRPLLPSRPRAISSLLH